MSGGPLAGMRVIDLTSVVVGPTATLCLADYGADVIKVESPQGDLLRTLGGSSKTGQLSGKFSHFNRNKRSLALDLKQSNARVVLGRLLEKADVFIANMRPAALKRLGLDAAALRARYPRLIICTLAGFRQDGPYHNRPAYDTIIQGMAGVAACNQRVLGEPRFVPLVFVDHVVGLIAAQCILAALYRREKTGEGQAIEVPMFENMAQFVLSEHLGEGSFVPRRGESGDQRVLNPLVRCDRPARAQAGLTVQVGAGALCKCGRVFRSARGSAQGTNHGGMDLDIRESGRSCRPGARFRQPPGRCASQGDRVLLQG
jgi:crotonobetainyl-CoA:carnitine CoA-transferase CaiB-like acyl-CoA transferase